MYKSIKQYVDSAPKIPLLLVTSAVFLKRSSEFRACQVVKDCTLTILLKQKVY